MAQMASQLGLEIAEIALKWAHLQCHLGQVNSYSDDQKSLGHSDFVSITKMIDPDNAKFFRTIVWGVIVMVCSHDRAKTFANWILTLIID